MKVLLATPGTDVGGAERIVLALAHALPQRGHEVVLWGPAGTLEPELADVPLHRLVLPNRERTALGVVVGVASLAAAVRRTRPHVVHAHNPRVAGWRWPRCGSPAVPAARRWWRRTMAACARSTAARPRCSAALMR